MAPSMTTNAFTFIVPQASAATRGGAAVRAAATAQTLFPQSRIKHSVAVGSERGEGGRTPISADPGEDVVVLHLANGPTLVLHPESAYDLMRAQQDPKAQARGASGGEHEAGEVEVPAQLGWPGLEAAAHDRGASRGFLGRVSIEAFEVLTGVSKAAAADMTADLVVKLVDSQVEPGVYALSATELPNLKKTQKPIARVPAAARPILVLVHGTFSTTEGTFKKLWLDHPRLVAGLFDHYGGAVYALDHKTLGDSPISNALTLAKALPQGARLHLVTHSRGGLVAEVMARVCHDRAVGADDFAAFEGDAYAVHRRELQELATLVRDRDIKVERVVRVACPARGTLLASKRLDAYVSVLKWTLELAKIPVAPEIVDFLGAVAQRRADPLKIPGLEAQVPYRPLINWLHAAKEPIAGELRVISGDIEGDSLASWLKTLVADAYYWTDNDFVVQTRSMYGGSPRKSGATFMYDRGGTVSHFNYFANKLTAEAITEALVSAAPAGFRTIGPLSWSGEDSSGVRGARAGATQGDRPALFLLPGILGSNLAVDGERVWVSWRLVNSLKRLEYAAGQQNVAPDGPIEAVYRDLTAYLERTHDVVEFGYDWRKPIEDEAKRLGAAIRAALDARASGVPVRILAHSMGGVLARTMQLECPEVWEDMMARDGARLLMLGVPNAGSWAPMQVLSGDDTFGNMIVSTGALLTDHKARALMAAMPGFIQLQAALLDPALGLDRSEQWKKLADDDLARVRDYNFWHTDGAQLNPYTWGVPAQDVLDKAVALRRALDRQRDETLPQYSDRIALVVGKSSFTPDGYDTGEQGLFYLDSADGGDGRVTLASALLPGVPTWQLDTAHGSLPADERAFAAYGELLEKGSTELLPPLATAGTRGGPLAPSACVASRPSRARMEHKPPESPGAVFLQGTTDTRAPRAARTPALQVNVVNGDLMFERLPLMLGHYTSTRLTGTERVMDALIGKRMSQALAMGKYPDRPGSHRVFVNACQDPENPWQGPRPEAVIAVGLGPEGKLRPSDLRSTVVDGVIAWAQRLLESRDGHADVFEMAATLIGSGGIGVSVGESAQAIVRGVQDANVRLTEQNWPTLTRLHLIDLYMDRAGEAWRALQVASAGTAGLCHLAPTIPQRPGALERPFDSGYRGADYDFISAVEGVGDDKQPAFLYTLDTRRARTEVRAQATQVQLLRGLLNSTGAADSDDPQLGHTLFELLVPLELRPFLAGTTDMQLELDRSSASIPWELLDTSDEQGSADTTPWAIRAKLLRKLRTQKFRSQVVDASADASVLIIGEPECNAARYDRLPHARDEAEAVSNRFGDIVAGARADPQSPAPYVKALISANPSLPGPDARMVMNALFERPWRIVHIAGHGELPLQNNARGVVLSDGFLGANEIRNLRVVPELVFVNCCHLASFGQRQIFQPSAEERASFAAGVAEALIEIGVRCVVAAGWAVSDVAAKAFANKFYDALLSGRRFIDAVSLARKEAFAAGGNTWAAYQCYGDPDWRFVRATSDAQRPLPAATDELAGIASAPGLIAALRTLEVRSKYQRVPGEAQRGQLRYLENRFASAWGSTGSVAEAFAAAWDAAGDPRAAGDWYERAVEAADGTATFRALEQLVNVRIRSSVEACRASAADADRARLHEAREAIEKHVCDLEKLLALRPSMERASLMGSAHKRLAIIARLAKNGQAEQHALECALKHYRDAENLGGAANDPETFYPLYNRLVVELCLGAQASAGGVVADIARLRRLLQGRLAAAPDFWSKVGESDLRLLEAVMEAKLAAERPLIEAGYRDLHERVSAVRNWASVYDTAAFLLDTYDARSSDDREQAAAAAIRRLLLGFASAA
jgi:hypothetical protein